MSDNLAWHEHAVTLPDRRKLLGSTNSVYWFTGLSGSGKSTLANALARRLHDRGDLVYVLDGDNVRHGLNSDLGFSSEDRSENIRRVAHVAQLLYDAGITVLVAFISPFRKDREYARRIIGDDFIEVHVDCPLQECESRDPKGLYRKVRDGEIVGFTGIDSPYERPEHPDIRIDTRRQEIDECARMLLERNKNVLRENEVPSRTEEKK